MTNKSKIEVTLAEGCPEVLKFWDYEKNTRFEGAETAREVFARVYECLDPDCGSKFGPLTGTIFDSKKNIVYRIKKKTKADGEATQNVEETMANMV